MKKTVLIFAFCFVTFNAFATMEAAWTDNEVKTSAISCPQFIYVKNPDGSYKEYSFTQQIKKRNATIDKGECVYR